jgi:hypothetical protein
MLLVSIHRKPRQVWHLTIGAFVVMGTLLGLFAGPLRGADVRQDVRAGTSQLVLLYDASLSQRALYVSPMSELGAPTFKERVATGVVGAKMADQIKVASFAQRFLLSPLWVKSESDIQRAFEQVLQPDNVGPSPIWDAVVASIEAFGPEASRRTLLLVSDGRASGNAHGFDEAVERAKAARVTVFACHVVALSQRSLEADRPGDPAFRLKQLAVSTGGRYSEPTLREVTRAIADLLANPRR